MRDKIAGGALERGSSVGCSSAAPPKGPRVSHAGLVGFVLTITTFRFPVIRAALRLIDVNIVP